jgi:DNA-binding transcriptional ArsR family regulator
MISTTQNVAFEAPWLRALIEHMQSRLQPSLGDLIPRDDGLGLLDVPSSETCAPRRSGAIERPPGALTRLNRRHTCACMRTRAPKVGASEPRRKAARELDGIVASKVFRALCEPARIQILKLLTLWGRSDVATIAAHVPQHPSVVSRHLAQLHEAGFLRREKVGRNVFFEMDGPAVVTQLEDVVARFRALVPVCCPGK